MKSIPSLNALRAFEAAARYQSFGMAADELCVTPAAISQQIKSLENHLGIRLFQRVGRRVVITQEGHMILPELREAFSLIEKSLSRLNDDETGLLTINTTLALAAKWLLPRIHHFQSRYPDIDIRLNTNDRLTRFEHENVDAAIIFGPGDYEGLNALPIKTNTHENIFPVCSPQLLTKNKPLKTVEDLKFHTLLHDDTVLNSTLLPDWKQWLSTANCRINAEKGLHFGNSVLAIEAAINGQGVALSCELVARDDLKAGRLIQPLSIPCTLEYSYHLIFPKRRVSKKVELFYEWLVEECK